MEKEQQLEDESDVIDVLRVLWKWKLLMVSLTLLVTVATWGVLMMLPKIYNISSIIEPGKNIYGNPVETPEAIRQTILSGSYYKQINKIFNLPLGEDPKWQVKIPKNTQLLQISVESDKPELAVRILNELLLLVVARIDERLQDEKKQFENDVKLAEITHNGLLKQVKLLTSQLNETAGKIEDMEIAGKNALTSHSSDDLLILLYFNEIQRQQVYLNKLKLDLSSTEQNVESAAIVIDNARLRLAQIKSTKINQHPTVPQRPIKPKKGVIMVMGLMIGVLFSILLVFSIECIKRVRKK